MDKIDRIISIIKEEGMTTGPNGFSNAADPKGPVAGRDELMFAKPMKRKLGCWIKSAIKQDKCRKKKRKKKKLL